MKRTDVLEKWSARTKKGFVYYFHRKAANGNIESVSKFKTRSGRSRAIKKILSKEKLKVTLRQGA